MRTALMTCRQGWFASLAILLLSACQAPLRDTVPLEPAKALPADSATRYSVDAQRSEVRVLAYREGPMAQLGHNHVVQGAVSGNVYLAPDFHESALELTMPLDSLVVDPAAARRQEGKDFASSPSAQAKAGTRKNMLGPDGIDAGKHPLVHLRSVSIIGPPWNPDITLQLSLHGIIREITVPVALFTHDNELTAIGTFTIRQSDFGLTPFSVMGGALRVKDELRIRFRIVAVSTLSVGSN